MAPNRFLSGSRMFSHSSIMRMMKMMSGGTLSMLRRMAVPDRMNSPRVKWGEEEHLLHHLLFLLCVFHKLYLFKLQCKDTKKMGLCQGFMGDSVGDIKVTSAIALFPGKWGLRKL